MGKFEEAYAQLNAAQREAVDTIDGPVLVIAGPGTGKTQLLSVRVANILRKSDADPGSILCLTFTNKAAINMRERILQLTEGTRDVVVKTFHSFAAELMNMYPDHFWNGARLTTAPDAVQLDIIQGILGKLPLDNPLALKFAGTFTAGRDVLRALRYAKEAGLTPDKLRALVEANIAYIDTIEPQLVDAVRAPLSVKKIDHLQTRIQQLPDQGIAASLQPLQDLGKVIKESLDFAIAQDQDTSKTTHIGKWKQRWVQTIEQKKGMFRERERNQWWLHVSMVYEKYRQELHSRGYYDYSDMLVEVISQLQTHPSLRADVQERFLYVLIDEFQDTNAAQLQLAHLIADHPESNGKPNIMVVGDDDQSIYKFNGAELNNMLSFAKSYPTLKTIVLTDNYRSTQAVLDTAELVIKNATDRLVNRRPDLTKKLRARTTITHKGELSHLRFPTEEHQLSAIVNKIKEEYEKGDHSQAVLARDHGSLRNIASLLLRAGVPVRYEQQNNILNQPAVLEIYTLAALVIAIQNGDELVVNNLLSRLVRGPAWGLTPSTLWKLAVHARNKSWLDYLDKSEDRHLKAIGEWLLWLSQQATHQPVQVMLEHIIGLRSGKHMTSPLRAYYLGASSIDTDYTQTLSAIRLLLATARDFVRTGSPSLEDFVNFIQLAIDTNEIVADESVFVSGDHAVELLTVHKAKGLEFDSVYVINAIDTSWRPSSGGRKMPANLPLQPVGDDNDDYARLMYVAVTRARHSVVVTSYQQDITGREVMASPLVASGFNLDFHEKKTKAKDVNILEQHITWPHLSIDDEKLILRGRLESFSLSATALIDFLDISQGGPQLFFERHLLALPEAQSPQMAFGSAIHKALELAQVLVNTDQFSEQKIVDRFQVTLANQQLPKSEFERYKTHGTQLINKLLRSDTFWLGKGGLPEQNIQDITIGNATINGKIDRIDTDKNSATIIDYKTGSPLSSFTTRDKTKAVKAWRHRSQLIFYCLLVQNSTRFKKSNIAGQMWYLEAEKSKELVREYTPSQEELTEYEKLISIVFERIVSLNLPDTRNYSPDYAGIAAFQKDLLSGAI